jgi:hypothetical protein
MSALMFGLWFKNMKLVISYLGCDFAIIVVIKYDEQLLLPLLIEAKNW